MELSDHFILELKSSVFGLKAVWSDLKDVGGVSLFIACGQFAKTRGHKCVTCWSREGVYT